MKRVPGPATNSKPARAVRTIAAFSAALMLSACSQSADLLGSSMLADSGNPRETGAVSEGGEGTELQRATMYWGQEYANKPTDLKAGMSYARNLKAMGEKRKALTVFQQLSAVHDGDPELAGEYGRLALELDQVGAASKLLAIADNPGKPDWKVISARGTVFAKQGDYKKAIGMFERALPLSNNHASVLNNLAMAHAMSGNAHKAEDLLRQAAAAEGAAPKVQQNLALVLGLHGRYDEAKTSIASAPASADQSAVVAADTDMLRRYVKVEAKPAPADIPPFATATIPTAQTAIAANQKSAAPRAETPLRPAATDDAATTEPWLASVAAANLQSAQFAIDP